MLLNLCTALSARCLLLLVTGAGFRAKHYLQEAITAIAKLFAGETIPLSSVSIRFVRSIRQTHLSIPWEGKLLLALVLVTGTSLNSLGGCD